MQITYLTAPGQAPQPGTGGEMVDVTAETPAEGRFSEVYLQLGDSREERLKTDDVPSESREDATPLEIDPEADSEDDCEVDGGGGADDGGTMPALPESDSPIEGLNVPRGQGQGPVDMNTDRGVAPGVMANYAGNPVAATFSRSPDPAVSRLPPVPGAVVEPVPSTSAAPAPFPNESMSRVGPMEQASDSGRVPETRLSLPSSSAGPDPGSDKAADRSGQNATAKATPDVAAARQTLNQAEISVAQTAAGTGSVMDSARTLPMLTGLALPEAATSDRPAANLRQILMPMESRSTLMMGKTSSPGPDVADGVQPSLSHQMGAGSDAPVPSAPGRPLPITDRGTERLLPGTGRETAQAPPRFEAVGIDAKAVEPGFGRAVDRPEVAIVNAGSPPTPNRVVGPSLIQSLPLQNGATPTLRDTMPGMDQYSLPAGGARQTDRPAPQAAEPAPPDMAIQRPAVPDRTAYETALVSPTALTESKADRLSVVGALVEGSEPGLASPVQAAPESVRIGPIAVLASPDSNPQQAARFSAQVAEILVRNGDGRVEISMRPEELGRISLTMSLTDSGVTITIAAERGDTMDLMRRHAETLATAFRALGHQDVAFDFQGQGNRSAPNPSETPAEPDGMTLQQPDSTPASSARRDPTCGLDLRV